MMSYKSILIFLMFFQFGLADSQSNCEKLHDLIFTNSVKNNYYEVHRLGKAAIPCLIECIDIDKKSFVGFQDPESSSINAFSIENYSGINAAYLIELILAKDSIISSKGSTWKMLVEPYRLFNYGVIVKNVVNKPILKPLEHEDVKALRKIYLTWWELNKGKSIKQLRVDWNSGKNPLTDSGYKWI